MASAESVTMRLKKGGCPKRTFVPGGVRLPIMPLFWRKLANKQDGGQYHSLNP